MTEFNPNEQNSAYPNQASTQGGVSSNYQNVYGAPANAATQQTQQTAQTQQTQQAAPYGAYPSNENAPFAAGAPQAQHAAAGAPQTPYAKEKKKGSSSAKTFLIAFAGALVACILAFGVLGVTNMLGHDNSNVNVTLGDSGQSASFDIDETTTLAEAVAEKCLPSVVSIDVYSQGQSGSGNSYYDLLYGYGLNSEDNGSLNETGLGSGVMLSKDGYVITNYHVVSGGTDFEVTVAGETYKAELIGQDESSDVAVLKVDGSDFNPITIGDSDNINIGQWVMSIGSPFGLEQSVATGIVSATSRSQIMDSSQYYGSANGGVTIYPNMIQTDAAINPGNSGGALVNAAGELIGINTLITSYSGNYSGVGFAIPINYALSIAQSIIAGEEPTHAQLGVNLTTVNEQNASRYGLAVNEGAYVSSVVEGSAAANAGIKQGDIVTAFDGEKVTSSSDLMLDVRTKNPGDKVSLEINRDGQTQTIEVELGSATSSGNATQQNSMNNQGNQGNSNGMNPFNPFNQ